MLTALNSAGIRGHLLLLLSLNPHPKIHFREREREKHGQSVAFCTSPNCKSNPQPFGLLDGAPTIEQPSQG